MRRLWLILEVGRIGSATTTLDKAAGEGLAWIYAVLGFGLGLGLGLTSMDTYIRISAEYGYGLVHGLHVCRR